MKAQREEKAPVDMLAAEIGRRIRAARLERGMSLADLGGNELTRSFLSQVELGRSRISLKALAMVADRLGLPISHFLDNSIQARDGSAEWALDRAEVALAQQHPSESLRLLDEADLTEELRPRGLALRGRALIEDGRARDAISLLQEGLSLVEQRGDRPLVTELSYLLGTALYNTGAYDKALVYLRRSLDDAVEGTRDPTLEGKITVAIGHILYMRGDFDGAIEHYTRARDLFGSLADLNTLGCVYSGLASAHKQMGDLATALRYSKLSVAVFEAEQNARQAARELNNLAVRYSELNDLGQALECARESVGRAQQVNAHDVEALAHSTLASILLRTDEANQAEIEALTAERLASDDTDPARVDAWIVLAEIAERRGDRERADDLYQRALKVSEQEGRVTFYANAALTYSLLLQRRGDTERALEYALQAAQARTTQPA